MKRSKTILADKFSSFLFILPALLVAVLLLVYPVTASVFYSFTSKHLLRPRYNIVGLGNYITTITDPDFYNAFLNSIKWTALSLIGQIGIGFTAALAVNSIRRGQGVYRTILIIPWAFPSIVIALSWKWILNGVYGFLPNFLLESGLVQTTPNFLVDPNLVFATLVFVNIWFGAPLIMVNVLSALQTVPLEQYEAAHIDGASTLQSFVHITFPHIRMVVGLLVVLRTIWVFNNFDIIFLITGGGPANLTQTLPLYAYNVGWRMQQLGRSSSVTVLLLLFLLCVSMLYFKLLDKWEREGE